MISIPRIGPVSRAASDLRAPTAAPSSPISPRRAEAIELIRKALAVPEKLAAGLPADQREKFLSQFAAWAKLAITTPSGKC
jgi:hypothetical protein